MPIIRNLSELPQLSNAVLTVGSFDGVHLGHQEILKQLVARAEALRGESVVITFSPHPRKLLFPTTSLGLLSTTAKKYERMLNLGVDYIVEVPFTRSFSMLSAREYIHSFLLQYFKPKAIVLGYDHHFGHDRAGNIRMLKAEVPEEVKIFEIEEHLVSESAVSSTKIRKALSHGDVEEVARLLGHRYALDGLVIKGKQLGRTIGYPTANLSILDADLLLPSSGVFAVKVLIGDNEFLGMMNIGKNPTVSTANAMNYEVHILDFDLDIYGRQLQVTFFEHIRSEQKFDGVASLKAQLAKDEAAVRQYFLNT